MAMTTAEPQDTMVPQLGLEMLEQVTCETCDTENARPKVHPHIQ